MEHGGRLLPYGPTKQNSRPSLCGRSMWWQTLGLLTLARASAGAASGGAPAGGWRHPAEPEAPSSIAKVQGSLRATRLAADVGGRWAQRPSDETSAGSFHQGLAPTFILAPWTKSWPPAPNASARAPARALTQSSNVHRRQSGRREGSGASGSQQKGNATGSDGAFVEPRVFFLFLTIDGIQRMDIWEAFFAGMPSARFRVMVHCKERGACERANSSSKEIDIRLVDTVPSSYCKDLVTPMVQLLKIATAESSSPNDKFVFLSERTLPVKPFPLLYGELVADQGSDVCVSPVPYWVKMRFQVFNTALLVKHSQWVVLNREHADAMVLNWQRVRVTDDVWSIPIFSEGAGNLKHAEIHGDIGICTDEWAFFSTIFGTIVDKGQPAVQNLRGFNGGPIAIHDGGHTSNGWQGVCRTFNFWRVDSPEEQSFLSELLHDMPNTKLSCWPQCGDTHPADFVAISDRGAGVLRRSRFLFARKFQGQVMSLDQFKRIILGPTP